MTRDVIRSAETWLYIHIYTNTQPDVFWRCFNACRILCKNGSTFSCSFSFVSWKVSRDVLTSDKTKLNSSAEMLSSFNAIEIWLLILLSISPSKSPSFSCFLAFATSFFIDLSTQYEQYTSTHRQRFGRDYHGCCYNRRLPRRLIPWLR